MTWLYLKDHSRYKYNSHKYLWSEEQLLYCIQKVFMLRRLSLYLNGANLSICDDLNHCHKYSSEWWANRNRNLDCAKIGLGLSSQLFRSLFILMIYWFLIQYQVKRLGIINYLFCPMGQSFWLKDSLITHILFEPGLFRHLAKCTLFLLTLYVETA